MLAQVRAFSTISRVIRAPQPTTPILSESTGNQRGKNEKKKKKKLFFLKHES